MSAFFILLNYCDLVAAGKYGWTAILPEAASGDTSENPRQSDLQLFEDGQPLGPAHSSHQDILEIGQGRYSHWSTTLYFSTSDNSSPCENGRSYTIKAMRASSHVDINGRIFVTPGGGYGNRFMIICSAMRIAEITGRTLYLDWQPQEEMPVELHDLFAEPYPFLIGKAPRYVHAACRDKNGVLISPPRVPALPPEVDINLWGNDYYAYADEPRSLTTLPYDNFVRDAGPFFRRLTLAADLQHRYDELVSKLDLATTLGVHIRRNAVNSIYSASDNRRDDIKLETYKTAIDIILERYPHLTSVYIASNNDAARDYMRHNLDLQVCSNERAGTGWHDKATLKEALVEMCVLSRCSVILRQGETSFSYIAASINSTPCVTIVGQDPSGHEPPVLKWCDWTTPMIIDS